MAFDEELADRVRALISGHGELSERRMFGGIGFMVSGNMAVGVIGENLIVRLDPEEAARALAEPGVREFDFTGRPMKGWVYVGPEVTGDDEQLASWVEAGGGFAPIKVAALAPETINCGRRYGPCTRPRGEASRRVRRVWLGPGWSASHAGCRLRLLPSGPDLVHGLALRGTWPSTPPAAARLQKPAPQTGIRPR